MKSVQRLHPHRSAPIREEPTTEDTESLGGTIPPGVPMSVSSVSGSTAAAASTNRPDPMADVAKLLNMSPSDLRDALKSGSSLSDVAAKQGVSRDDLLQQIQTDLQNRPAQPGQSGTASTTDVSAEAAKIADTKGLPQHHGHHRHGGGGVGAAGSLFPSTTDAGTVSAQAGSGSLDVLL